jgi:hypothetical protein
MAEVVEGDYRPWWLRLRSALLLTLLLVGIGVLTAVLVGVGAVAVTALLNRALA